MRAPIHRRSFITLLGGAAATWPLAARAQQPVVPVIGFLAPAAPDGAWATFLAGFRRGLSEMGFIEGRNVAIEFRWAEGQFSRLPGLAADLARRNVAVIAAFAPPAALAAQSATKTIPIVFLIGSNPIELGLVSSFNRPGSNITGVSFLTTALGAKRIGLLSGLISKGAAITLIVNPRNPVTEVQVSEVQAAANTLGHAIQVLNADNENEIDKAFATHAEHRNEALILGADSFFNSRLEQIVALSKRYATLGIFPQREYAEAGGLMSYGSDASDAARQTGLYVARIVRGEKPAELPVMQSTKFELVINLKTSRTLGLSIPPMLLALADEAIE